MIGAQQETVFLKVPQETRTCSTVEELIAAYDWRAELPEDEQWKRGVNVRDVAIVDAIRLMQETLLAIREMQTAQ